METCSYVLSPASGSPNTPRGAGEGSGGERGGGQSGSKVTKVPIDENKIRRGGRAAWGGGERCVCVGGSREMRVFVFKEEIG